MNQPTYLDLVYEYFKTDILKTPLPPDLRIEIIDTFQYAFAKGHGVHILIKELEETRLEKIRCRIMSDLHSNLMPYPVKLGELRPLLRSEAVSLNRSLHSHIIHILRDHSITS